MRQLQRRVVEPAFPKTIATAIRQHAQQFVGATGEVATVLEDVAARAEGLPLDDPRAVALSATQERGVLADRYTLGDEARKFLTRITSVWGDGAPSPDECILALVALGIEDHVTRQTEARTRAQHEADVQVKQAKATAAEQVAEAKATADAKLHQLEAELHQVAAERDELAAQKEYVLDLLPKRKQKQATTKKAAA